MPVATTFFHAFSRAQIKATAAHLGTVARLTFLSEKWTGVLFKQLNLSGHLSCDDSNAQSEKKHMVRALLKESSVF